MEEQFNEISNRQSFDPKRRFPYWACARAFSVQEALWACIYSVVNQILSARTWKKRKKMYLVWGWTRWKCVERKQHK